MRSQIVGLRVASVIFGLISLAQLARFVVGGRVIVGGHALPLWPSAIAFFVFGGLSVWLWSLSRQNFVRQLAAGLTKKL
ncbi:MAG TPA: hypothetical protein VL754_11925 [Verrucomicrobiae bacterium]|jgi:hypothetical protein|nr:hypothetical protein [Verrucomicrobiae bacterium]